MRLSLYLAALSGGVLTTPAVAGTTTTYTYDTLGRLTGSATTGTVNNGVVTEIKLDPADNRTSQKVTGGSTRVIVVPLNGYTVLPIPER